MYIILSKNQGIADPRLIQSETCLQKQWLKETLTWCSDVNKITCLTT